jgi:3-ketosteroid 9alpha-monooxygenase subunit B
MSSPRVVSLRVAEVVRETADAHSLVLEPVEPDTGSLTYRPGQFLTLRVPSDHPGGAARCYSLCSSPDVKEPLAVTVKRTPSGYASNWICDNVRAGDVLEALRPSGTFTPTSLDGDLLLAAAGSGVTPVLSILKSVLSAGTGTVVLLYANRDQDGVIFRATLEELAREHPDRLTVVHWLESVQGLPTAALLRGLLTPYVGREAFVCGPGPFMDVVSTALVELGTPSGRVHVERFTSLMGDPFAERSDEPPLHGPGSELHVVLDGATHTLSWPRERKLLDVLLDAGLDAPYSCREGACSACACYLLEGEVDLERNEVLESSDLAEGIVLACQAVPRTERVRVSYDE